MIINPQEFNYKATIGILVVVIAVFSAYGLSSYSALKSNKDFLVQQKSHLHNELSEIINRYDELNSENLTLKSQLDSTIYRVRITNNAIQELEAKAVFNSSLQNELTFLKAQKSSLENREDSLIRVAQQIESEKLEAIQELNIEKASKNNALKENVALIKRIDKASAISANSFLAKASKLNNSNKTVETIKAKDAEQIELSFVIAENGVASKGTKELYIQIIDPENNIVSDKGAISFDDELLIYSKKENLYYTNSSVDVRLTIKNELTFKPGHYYINVFENNRRLGGTEIELN